ncbi:MAG: hypothetical protein IJX63_04400 [Lachnospiraceae bacterium]|nr:hypothetical protein [Lachnospiraceae bacterium]
MKDSWRDVLKKITCDGDWAEPIYYTVSMGRNLVTGLIFSVAALGLGWLVVTMWKSGYIWESLLLGILFTAAFFAGPVQIYKLLRELAARVKRYRESDENQ